MLRDHECAVNEFIGAARRFPGAGWSQPLAPGKWSPAELSSHLIESYQCLRRELTGEPGMRLLGSPVQRWLLRHTILRGILHGDPASALSALEATADGFAQELSARGNDRRLRLSHAYFGPMSAQQSLQLVAIHTRHHARQLGRAAG